MNQMNRIKMLAGLFRDVYELQGSLRVKPISLLHEEWRLWVYRRYQKRPEVSQAQSKISDITLINVTHMFQKDQVSEEGV